MVPQAERSFAPFTGFVYEVSHGKNNIFRSSYTDGDDWQLNMTLIWILKVEITPLNLAGVLI